MFNTLEGIVHEGKIQVIWSQRFCVRGTHVLVTVLQNEETQFWTGSESKLSRQGVE